MLCAARGRGRQPNGTECHLMEQRGDGTFYFGDPVLTQVGHFEGIMGSLQVDHTDGYQTTGYIMEPK